MSEVPVPGMMLVRTRRCQVCGAHGVVQASREGVEAWRAGAMVQDALPELGDDELEQLISGTHPACWSRLWSI